MVGLGNWLIDNIVRPLFFFLDSLLYGFAAILYDLFTQIAETTIFTEDIIDLFTSKVYTLLGVFMLFKVSFSILTYLVNPDDFLDKSKGFSKLISNIMITLALLILTPFIFSEAMDIQKIILKDNIIGKIFSASEINTSVPEDPGNTMAYETFRAFYHLDTNLFPECEGIETGSFVNEDTCKQNAFNNDSSQFELAQEILQEAHKSNNINDYMNQYLLKMRGSNDQSVMYYMPFISTIAGFFLALLLIIFCFDVALRSVKLGFLRMVAPIPIVSRIDPQKGKDTFGKWVKVCLSTYLDLFIRLLAIYFAVFVIGQLTNLHFVDAVTGEVKEVDLFVRVFIIFGALLFAKQLPQLIQDLTGVKLDGKFTLNPMKKFKEVPGVEKIGGTAGGLIAGIKAGDRVGNKLLGAAMGLASGYKASTWLGDGKGGFMAGANSTYKKLMGKDFLNFQYKPGGTAAVEEVSKALKNAYGIKTEFERELNEASSISNHWAEELVKNGVDINGNLGLQAQTASSKISALSGEISSIQQQIATAKSQMAQTNDKATLDQLSSKIGDLQNILSQKTKEKASNQTIVEGIQKYSESTEKELSIRTAIEAVSKDIKDLSTEKSQRESFYGVDPSPAVKVSGAMSRANNGPDSYKKGK